MNHLVAMTDQTKGIFTSEYIVRRLALDCEDSFITHATSHSKWLNNPSFDGHVLEMDVLHAIAKSIPHRFKLLGENDPFPDSFDDSFTCDSIVSFAKVEEIELNDKVRGGGCHWFSH